jgi:hypothetical protein
LVAKCAFAVLAAALAAGWGTEARAQGGPLLPADAGGCSLKDHVYTCDGAAFQKMLGSAKTVSIETHNADGAALGGLTDLVTKKLGKTVAATGGEADLIAVLIPRPPEGVVNGAMDATLGTLSFYSAGPGGVRWRLVWVETYSGTQDLPWPAVVHGLIAQFQDHFHIK